MSHTLRPKLPDRMLDFCPAAFKMQCMEPGGANKPFHQLLGRFLRFGLVGGSGVVVDMSVLYLLADPHSLGWNLSGSKTLAAEAAIINNFIWNDVWTFRDLSASQPGWHGRAGRFLKFNLICLIGIVLNLLLLNGQVHFFGMNIYVANFIAIFLVSLWNFWMNLRFGWSKSEI